MTADASRTRRNLPRIGRGVALRALILCGLAVAIAFPAQAGDQPAKLVDPPFFAEKVSSGALPAIAERVPQHPAVVALAEGQTIGQQGGDLRTLMSSGKDVRLMVVYAYARLIGYDAQFKLVPDIAEAVDIEENRSFTFHLRPGHKWSDGEPFTAEDFRYYWEDVANNTELSPTGPDSLLLVEGEAPKVEIVDATTVRYSWSKPNPDFLPALAGASPLYIYRPAHYLKKYHKKYADAAALGEMVEESGQTSWAALHNRKDNMYRNDNPELPTLDPWMLVTKPPSERFVFERNPYYYRVDSEGKQLPYIDRIIMAVADSKLIPAKVGAGEADLAARYLRFDNYTFLKEGEAHGSYKVRLWSTANGSALALYPNLNVNDPVWRKVLRDVRFRRALSLGIDRDEINEVIYHGLANPSSNTERPESPLFEADYQGAWATFDIDQANALLDEIGLTEKDDRGLRLLPNGEPLEIVVETMGQAADETDVLQLIHDSWQQIGVGLFTKPSERDVVRNRIFSGDTIMSVWTGLEFGLPTADQVPRDLAPTSQQQLQWPKWGEFVETKGQSGEAVDMPEAKQLDDLLKKWMGSTDEGQRNEIWHSMLEQYADNVFTIGTVNGVPQPIVVRSTLRNVPEKGVFSWDPGAHFGMYKPDTFWFGS
jgi:peptide/nickel transport system substrate-binding protein